MPMPLPWYYGNTAQSAFGISWKICALISSLFLEVHNTFGRLLKYICEKVPLSEPKFSQDLLLPNYAVLPYENRRQKHLRIKIQTWYNKK